MMDHLRRSLVSLLLLGQAVVQGAELSRRQATSKYCDPGFADVCLSQFSTSPSNIVFRIAIPDDTAGSFDTLLQIVAPTSIGWAGIAWGGGMTNNPLTVSWPNGNGAIVSSRWATGHTVPGAYSGASYKTLASSKNATHWQISVVCSGCSQWNGGSIKADGSSQLAWAMGTGSVSQSSNNASAFSYHNSKGRFSVDFSASKVAKDAFEEYQGFLAKGSGGAPASPPPAPSSSSPAPPPPASSPSRAPPPAPSTSAPAPPAPTSAVDQPYTTVVTVTAAPPVTTPKPKNPSGDDDDEDEDEDDGETTAVTITMGPIGGPPFRRPPFKGKGKRIRPPIRPPFKGPRT